MGVCNLRKDKLKLKSLLMKNVKTDDKGRVLLSKDDEWREEEWYNIDNQNDENKEDVAIKVPLVDMIFDPEKRKVIYRKYDKEYSSSKEEDEIFEEMRGNIFNRNR